MPSETRREPLTRGTVARAAAEALRDGGLVRASKTGADGVRELLCALVLRSVVGAAASSDEISPELEPVRAVALLLDRGTSSLREAGAASRALTSPDAAHLATLVTEPAAVALLEAARAHSGDLGACYEELLELGVRELREPSFRVRPDGVWISAHALLGTSPSSRSKRLQRDTGLPKSAVERLAASLSSARTEKDVAVALEPVRMAGSNTGARGEVVLDASVARRRSGSHYTPPPLSRSVISRALAPLLEGAASDQLLALRIVDPAMGTGAFLVQAGEILAGYVMVALHAEGRLQSASAAEQIRTNTLHHIARHCLYGVDQDPIAVDLARWTLARRAHGTNRPFDLSIRLRAGDALVGSVPGMPRTNARSELPDATFFDWGTEFPDVFGGSSAGFDLCIGNPPWVAYAGRAAQPIRRELAKYYEATNPAFHGYRTLHGLFTRRAAELLRPGGRLGLIVPTSMADLDGYAPSRLAHDALAVVDTELMDFGNGAFDGVFQPCMAVTSTRRSSAPSEVGATKWPLARPDLDAASLRLLARLDALPKVPPALFGERGFQTTGDDLAHLRRLPSPEPPFTVPIREGVDISEFGAHPPRTFIDATGLAGRFRPLAEWTAVSVLIRQTARYPIAAVADGVPFRNSILAGFATEAWSPDALAAYLNSSAVRWYHYVKHRDARQGMPQLKIGHLRALPEVASTEARERLDKAGRALGEDRKRLEEARAELDLAAFDALAFDDAERALVTTWAAAHPPPKPRR